MKQLVMDKEQKRKLCAEFALSPTTLHEVTYFLRPECKRHAEIANYAVNELGARVIDV